MSMLGWVLSAVVLVSSPAQEWRRGVARFTFELGGVEVGMVEFEGRCYRSTHFFVRGPPRVRADCEVTELPGVSWSLLLRRTMVGCLAVREELTGREGALCVTRRAGAIDQGTALDQHFTARYGDDGSLQELVLGSSRFVRRRSPPRNPERAPLDGGVPLRSDAGGVLTVDPHRRPARLVAFTASRWTRAEVEAAVAQERAQLGAGECLVLARRLVARLGADTAEVLYGLAEDGGRVYPHAWIRVQTRDAGDLQLDGALGVPVTRATHLALSTSRAPGNAGDVYVALLEGRARVSRRPVTRRE